ncbi:hypothetical protein RHMOL_Rhmol07G0273500 [Rhododendron molle]|uniref:Uncharacterized protein n=1 Tax=Rhododendron molle TaxID=49168 RepID=A0ACC0N6S1_RHOML|nr:hypothetical protein RHMOL_Rhmol07G0273500 [Rhododendron molle]
MAIRHLLSLSRRSATRSLRYFSTASPSPPHIKWIETYTIIQLFGLQKLINQKLKLLDNPDPRFLTHNSPHPTLADNTPILSSPLTRITILPFGLRIATESNLASKTATVCLLNKLGALSLSHPNSTVS